MRAALSAFRWSDYVGLQWCQRQNVSAIWSLMTLMTIWIEDFLFSNSLCVKPCKLLVFISPLPNTLSLYIGVVLARPSENKLILFSDAVLLFIVDWRQNMLFLTSELANKAEIAILSARDTTSAWVPGHHRWKCRGI